MTVKVDASQRQLRRTPEELEIEYLNLKAIFGILETDNFKYTDFEYVSYLDNYETKEIEIFSEKYGIHKIIPYAFFIKKFRVSPYYFVKFLNLNGAIDEGAAKKQRGYLTATAASEALTAKKLKVGQSFLDPNTGFWKTATALDVENFEKKRKESLYADFDEIFFNELDGKLPE